MTTNKYIILFFALMFFASCEDAIDITQPGRFSADIAYSSVDDLELGLLGTYDELDVTTQMSFTSTFTDEVAIGFDNGGQGLGDGRYGFILNSTSGAASGIWVNQYDAINAATRLIEASSLIEVADDERDRFNNVLGQAYAIRAWSHFQLFAFYTPDYTNDSDLSVIAVDFIPEIDQELGRNTAGELKALINRDMDQAEGLLDDDNTDRTFINKDFIKALRARFSAYIQDYGTAEAMAAELTNKYPLATQISYFNMWLDDNSDEVIFKLERSFGDNYDSQQTDADAGGWAGAIYAFVNATKDGSPYFEMGRALFNKIDPNDVRYSSYIDESSLIDPNYETNPNRKDDDILVIKKYPGSEGNPLMNDLKIFRSSEMVLIRAEAAAANGDLGGAANFIKLIRDARLGGGQDLPSYASGEEAFKDILLERRIELAFEGHRYLDIKRLGQRANESIDRDPFDCEVNGACELANDDYRFTFPIPQVETNANSVIREQQNAGY
jgi:hypothetical protein